jgi:hypothetical protein
MGLAGEVVGGEDGVLVGSRDVDLAEPPSDDEAEGIVGY